MAVLTDRQKIGHLLRRFGFGASLAEMEAYVPLGVQGTIDKLLDISQSTDVLHPLNYAFKDDKTEAEPGGYRFRIWWALQMVMSETPLREKMALFWHDHFAVNEEDVAHGLAMYDYLERLRENPLGKFKDTLGRFAKSPAVLRQLNVELLSKITPNENFARELMELYTLGEGNYSEKDIKEISLALTGWAHIDVYWRMGKTNDERLRNMMVAGTSGVFYIYAPDINIKGKKQVLGKSVETGDDVLDLLSHHPQTARYICTKLWEFFAYAKPEKSVIDRLAMRFMDVDGEIRLVLKEMAQMDEFYGDKSYRKLIKSPTDYVLGIARAMQCGERFKKDIPKELAFDQPVPKSVWDQSAGIFYQISQSGQDIFYPPTVAGWDWHDGWISTNILLRRKEVIGVYTWYPVMEEGKDTIWHPDEPVRYVVNEIRKRQPTSIEDIVNYFCTVYDCPLSPTQQQVMAQHFTKMGALQNIGKDREFGWACTTALKLLGSAPEFQLC